MMLQYTHDRRQADICNQPAVKNSCCLESGTCSSTEDAKKTEVH